jgi:hypothetical protein
VDFKSTPTIVKKSHENPGVGVLLCRNKNDEVVEYEIALIPKELLVESSTNSMIYWQLEKAMNKIASDKE